MPINNNYLQTPLCLRGAGVHSLDAPRQPTTFEPCEYGSKLVRGRTGIAIEENSTLLDYLDRVFKFQINTLETALPDVSTVSSENIAV